MPLLSRSPSTKFPRQGCGQKHKTGKTLGGFVTAQRAYPTTGGLPVSSTLPADSTRPCTRHKKGGRQQRTLHRPPRNETPSPIPPVRYSKDPQVLGTELFPVVTPNLDCAAVGTAGRALPRISDTIKWYRIRNISHRREAHPNYIPDPPQGCLCLGRSEKNCGTTAVLRSCLHNHLQLHFFLRDIDRPLFASYPAAPSAQLVVAICLLCFTLNTHIRTKHMPHSQYVSIVVPRASPCNYFSGFKRFLLLPPTRQLSTYCCSSPTSFSINRGLSPCARAREERGQLHPPPHRLPPDGPPIQLLEFDPPWIFLAILQSTQSI